LLLGFDHGGSELCVEVQPDLPPTEGLEGCTPGFWKNHPAAWTAPYTPGTPLNSVFTAAPAGPSLSDALRFQGGSDAAAKTRILLRAAVAALLNIAHSDIDYPLTVADLVAVVNDAIVNGTNEDKTTLAGQIDELNNAGCPINGR
jgi:hypothetical protein